MQRNPNPSDILSMLHDCEGGKNIALDTYMELVGEFGELPPDSIRKIIEGYPELQGNKTFRYYRYMLALLVLQYQRRHISGLESRHGEIMREHGEIRGLLTALGIPGKWEDALESINKMTPDKS